MYTEVIGVRVTPELKEAFEAVCQVEGTDTGKALRAYIENTVECMTQRH